MYSEHLSCNYHHVHYFTLLASTVTMSALWGLLILIEQDTPPGSFDVVKLPQSNLILAVSPKSKSRTDCRWIDL